MGGRLESKWTLLAVALVPAAVAGAAAAMELRAGPTAEISAFVLTFRIVLVVCLGFGAAAVAGYYAWTDTVPQAEYDRVVEGTVAALLVWLPVAGLVVLSMPAVDTATWGSRDWGWALSLWLLVGAATGFLLSGHEARIVERTRLAERERVKRNHLEAEHERLTFINRLLRHNLLNGINIITGHTSLLAERFEEVPPELETIQARCDVMVDHIQDVRQLMRVTVDDVETGRVTVSEVLEQEVDRLRNEFDDVEVEARIHPTIEIIADDLLGSVFENLLQNAVEHNDAETPRVTIDATVGSDTATIRIADNGPGIPEARKEQLNEYDFDNATLGLYLVTTLVTRYGGEIDFADNTPRGTVVTVELPLAHTGGVATGTATESDAAADDRMGEDAVGARPSSANTD